jgi:hypothetical protein
VTCPLDAAQIASVIVDDDNFAHPQAHEYDIAKERGYYPIALMQTTKVHG